ncbi:MAG: hypothetical protein V4657_07245 [Pseudomonadota bacterium]
MTSSTKALREALAHVGLHGKLADAVLPIIEQERTTAHREGMEAAAVIADDEMRHWHGQAALIGTQPHLKKIRNGKAEVANTIADTIRAQMEKPDAR